jgi:hypothetical protein
VRPTAAGPFTTIATVTAPSEQNTANNGPATNTITVVRTCAVYNGDGSSFPCGRAATPNTNNSQSINPSNAICCVSCRASPFCDGLPGFMEYMRFYVSAALLLANIRYKLSCTRAIFAERAHVTPHLIFPFPVNDVKYTIACELHAANRCVILKSCPLLAACCR